MSVGWDWREGSLEYWQNYGEDWILLNTRIFDLLGSSCITALVQNISPQVQLLFQFLHFLSISCLLQSFDILFNAHKIHRCIHGGDFRDLAIATNKLSHASDLTSSSFVFHSVFLLLGSSWICASSAPASYVHDLHANDKLDSHFHKWLCWLLAAIRLVQTSLPLNLPHIFLHLANALTLTTLPPMVPLPIERDLSRFISLLCTRDLDRSLSQLCMEISTYIPYHHLSAHSQNTPCQPCSEPFIYCDSFCW